MELLTLLRDQCQTCVFFLTFAPSHPAPPPPPSYLAHLESIKEPEEEEEVGEGGMKPSTANAFTMPGKVRGTPLSNASNTPAEFLWRLFFSSFFLNSPFTEINNQTFHLTL